MRPQHTLAVAPHLLISKVCTPYLLSIRYFPGSPAWQIRLPSLYLVGGNIHVSVIAGILLQFYLNLLCALRNICSSLPLPINAKHSGASFQEEVGLITFKQTEPHISA